MKGWKTGDAAAAHVPHRRVLLAAIVAAIALTVTVPGLAGRAAAANMPSTSGSFEIVIQMEGAAPGTSDPAAPSAQPSSGSGAGPVLAFLPRSGDPLSWLPVAVLAAASAFIVALAWRKNRSFTASAGRQSRSHALGAHAAAGRRGHKRSDVRIPRGPSALSVLAVFVLAGVVALPVLAQAEDPVQKVVFKADAAGNVKQTQTVHLDNAESYRAFLSHAVVVNENGWYIESKPSRAGDVAIRFAPASGKADAVDVAPVADGWDADDASDWTAPGTASAGDAGIDLEVTVEAKGASPGSTGVAMFSYELEAQPYEDLAVEVSYDGDLELGVPVKANVGNLPADGSNTLSYRWQSSDDGGEWVDVPGEVEDTLVPGVELAFRKVRVVVECKNPAWYAVPGATSGETVQVHAETAKLTLMNPKSGADPVEQTVVVGSTAPDPVPPTAAGYTFEGWFTDDGTKWNFGSDKVQADIKLTAQWSPNKNTPYVVKHSLQNVSKTGYELVDAENLAGETDSEVTPAVRTFAGFTAPPTQTVTIDPAGKTVIDYRYNRVDYTVSFEAVLPSGKSATDVTGMPTQGAAVAYQGTLTASVAGAPAIEGYDFLGWYTRAGEEGNWTYQAFGFGTDPIVEDVTLYARWQASSNTPYTVEYYQQNVAQTDYVKVEAVNLKGETDSTATAEVKNYKGFEHRVYDAAAFTLPVESGQVVSAGTLVLKVYYDRSVSAVVYKTAYGQQPEEVNLVYGADVPLPTLSAEGYSFGGWYADEDCTAPWTGTMPAEDITLHAKWTVNKHTLRFDVGGRGNAPADQRVDYGITATEPTAPTAAGYTFEGWYENADYTGAAYDFTTPMPDRDVTLYAKWSPRVKFLPGADGVTDMPSPDEVTVARGSVVAQPAAPSRTGYTFAGWYDEAGVKWNFGSAVQANVTLTARWAANKYTVTFDKGEGTVTGSTGDQVMTYDQEANLAANGYSRAGYTFAGWKGQDGRDFADRQSVKNLTSEAHGTFVMTARWAEGKAGYTVYHYRQKLDGNNPAEGAYQIVDVDTEYLTSDTGSTVSATPKAGGDYAGFTVNQEKSSLQGVVAGDGSLKLHVYYDRDTTTEYTITRQYQNADGTWGEAEADSQKAHGTTGAQAVYEANTGVEYQEPVATYNPSSGVIAGDGSTVVALRYARKANTVDFDTNGHGSTPNSQSVLYGSTAAKPDDLAATGWTFHDWYEQGSLEGGNAYNFASAVTGYLKLFAKWTANQYTIAFDPDGGTVDLTRATKTYGTNLETLPTPARAGYTFAGWFTQKGGSGTQVTVSSELSNESGAEVTVYAKWTANADTKYKVRYWQQGLNSDQTGVATTYTEMTDDERSEEKGNAPVGVTGTSTGNYASTEAGKYAGFHPTGNTELAAKAEATIAGDGSAVVDVYYDRNADTPYKVEHYQQKLNQAGTAIAGTDKATDYAKVDTDDKTGITGAVTSAEAKSYEGFTLDGSITQTSIAADGTLVMKVYYNRNVYKYAVTHSKQDLDQAKTGVANTYTEVAGDKQENIEAPYGATTQASAKSYEGFTAQDIVQGTLPANDNLVVDVRYNRNSCTVSFDANGQNVAVPAALEVPYGAKVSELTGYDPNVAGLYFDAWFEDADCTIKHDFDDAVVKGITLYAHWVNVRFNANYGSFDTESTLEDAGRMDGMMYETNVSQPLKANTFNAPASKTSDDYVLACWNTEANGSGAYVLDEEDVALITANGQKVTLYAQWSHIADKTSTELKEISAQITAGGSGSDIYKRYLEYAKAGDLWVSKADDEIGSGSMSLPEYGWDKTGAIKAAVSTRAVDKYLIVHLVDVCHDSLWANASKQAGLTFMSLRALPLLYQFNPTKTNEGGWAASNLRANMYEGSLHDMMPTTLSANVAEVSKASSTGLNRTDLSTSANNFYLPAAHEFWGDYFNSTLEATYSVGEGEVFAFFTKDSGGVFLYIREADYTNSGALPVSGVAGASNPLGASVAQSWCRSPVRNNKNGLPYYDISCFGVHHKGQLLPGTSDFARGINVCFSI